MAYEFRPSFILVDSPCSFTLPFPFNLLYPESVSHKGCFKYDRLDRYDRGDSDRCCKDR